MLTTKYDKFMKKMEMIYLYHECYGMNSQGIAYIMNSDIEVTRCYCDYLLNCEYVKNYIEKHIVKTEDIGNGGNIVE